MNYYNEAQLDKLVMFCQNFDFKIKTESLKKI